MLLARRRMLIPAAFMAMTLALSACEGDGSIDGSGGGGASDDTLTVVAPDSSWTWALDNAFGGLEPSLQAVGATLIRKPYDDVGGGFLAQNVNEYEPYLAESWDVSDDGLTYTFHLSNAISAQGNELTADDVIWSWERRFATATSISPPESRP